MRVKMKKREKLKNKEERKITNILSKNEKGITLLVLIVTIIILLILAGITIGALTGDNGLIKNARQSKRTK